ncbi:unnamed protein product, partial [marine sediment metagenome]
DYNQDKLIIKIEDNGKGMTPEFLKDVLDPFKTTRKPKTCRIGTTTFFGSSKKL